MTIGYEWGDIFGSGRWSRSIDGSLAFDLRRVIVDALTLYEFSSLEDEYSVNCTNGVTAYLSIDNKHVKFYGMDVFARAQANPDLPTFASMNRGTGEGADRFMKIFDEIHSVIKISELL